MTPKNYREFDELEPYQDTLLALAIYDWYFFNDNKIYDLKKDYNISAKNQDIFNYYHTNKQEYFEINHDRYVKKYKLILQSILYN